MSLSSLPLPPISTVDMYAFMMRDLLIHSNKNASECDHFYSKTNTDSRVAQWKRAGPITQRSVDRNYALLRFFLFKLTYVAGVPLQKKLIKHLNYSV